MMGPRQVEQGVLFYNFSLDAHVPADHLLRSIDRFVDLSELRRELAPFYSTLGRPSIDPELMIRTWGTAPMAQPRCSGGSSTSMASNHM
jgi:transposase